MWSWHGPQAKPSLLWWGPSDSVAPPAHSPAAQRPTSNSHNSGLRIQLIGHLIPLTAPCGFGNSEKNTTHNHFFIYKPLNSARGFVGWLFGNLCETIPNKAWTQFFGICIENCRCSTPGLFCPITWPAPCTGLVQSLDTASSLNTPQLAFQYGACTLLPDPP